MMLLDRILVCVLAAIMWFDLSTISIFYGMKDE